MAVQNRVASLIGKLLIVAVSIAAILMNTGLLDGTFAPYRLLYYTIFSCLLCLVFYLASAIATAAALKRTGTFGPVRFAPHFKGAIVMAEVMASAASFTLFTDRPLSAASPFALAANLIAHLLLPLLVLLDWLLFDRKGRFAAADPPVWTVVPLAYYGLVLLGAQLGLKYYGGAGYPYPFINPDQIGWGPVLKNVVVIAAIYLAAGYLLFGLDRLLGLGAKKGGKGTGNTRHVYHAGDAASPGQAAATDKPESGYRV